MARTKLPQDAYAALNHKAAMEQTSLLGHGANWIPPHHQRRQLAYRILTAYLNNNSGWVLDDADPDHRSYGDARMMVNRVVSGVLSKQFAVSVDGATAPDEFEQRPEPEPAADGSPEPMRRLAEFQRQQWEEQLSVDVDAWISSWDAFQQAAPRQQWLNDWWGAEQVGMKIVEAESDLIVPLGDGVFVLAWDSEKQRPTVELYAPDFYFPVIEPGDRGFPTKIHLAWEEPNDQGESEFLRRITYELRPIAAARVDGEDVLIDGDLQVGDEIRRRLPWHNGDEYTTATCYFTDMRWKIGPNGDWGGLAEARAEVLARDVDLLFDFLPIVHVPNTPATIEHYGRSLLSSVAQLLDDIGSFDLQHAESAAIAATPIVWVSGMSAKSVMDMEAGTILPVPSDGAIGTVTTAAALDQLQRYSEALDDRLVRNVGLGKSTTGGGVGSQASGLRVRLERAPFEDLIGVMRLTRSDKYALMAKFAQRIAIVHDGIDGDVSDALPVTVHFGPATPSDVSEVVESIVDLVNANLMSRRTALTHLAEVLPAGDPAVELRLIASEDHAGAKDLADATGSETAAAEYLGIDTEPPPTVAAPIVNLPS